MHVWVLHIHHRFGDDYFAHATEDGAKDALLRFCQCWWNEHDRGDLPLTVDEVISVYFDTTDDEWYGLNSLEVKP